MPVFLRSGIGIVGYQYANEEISSYTVYKISSNGLIKLVCVKLPDKAQRKTPLILIWKNEDLKNPNAQKTKVKSHKLADSKLKLFHTSKEDTAKWTDNLGDRMR